MQYSEDVEGRVENSGDLKYECQGVVGLNSRVMGGPDPGFHYAERTHC